jgi:hypothetical protein
MNQSYTDGVQETATIGAEPRDMGDLWSIKKPCVNDLHATMKPVELMERAITNSSVRGAIVLDPFGGSGSTLIACEATERRARLLELDPKYVDVIVKRWQDYMGQRAVLEADGENLSKSPSNAETSSPSLASLGLLTVTFGVGRFRQTRQFRQKTGLRAPEHLALPSSWEPPLLEGAQVLP